MKDIRDIFKDNIKLSGYVDKAVILCRQGRYDEALGMFAESGDGINSLCEAVIENREYFANFSTDYIAEMLQAILAAKKHKDYILLADLYEISLAGFISSIQEHIIAKEDFLNYDTENYNNNIKLLELKLERGSEASCAPNVSFDELELMRVNRNAELESPLSPEFLLEKGYSVEFTSCGLMTLRAPLEDGNSIYLHTNGNVIRESFLTADRWRNPEVTKYVVYGLGMGYHVRELLELEKFADVTVFESDINVLKLYCAFSEGELLKNNKVMMVYDPDAKLIERKLTFLHKDEKGCVHYPSLRRITPGEGLLSLAPFAKIVEHC